MYAFGHYQTFLLLSQTLRSAASSALVLSHFNKQRYGHDSAMKEYRHGDWTARPSESVWSGLVSCKPRGILLA